MKRPLEGVRVLTVEHYGAGPYATLLMSELGAEVIKIEAPSMGGDASRTTGPFMLGENDSQYFQTFSRGKKSVAIELKTAQGRADFERLVASAEAVVNNLRGDQPARLGLAYEALKAINPAIVCGHLSAYGRGNSREGWPGYDYPMQAECGLMSLTGEPDGPPARMGVSIIDFMSGTTFAFGVVSAILSARSTGEGCDVDVSLFDVALHQLSYPAVWAMNERHPTERMPNGAHPSLAPVQRVKTADGYGQLMCMNEKFWTELCVLIARPDLAADPRFAKNQGRVRHRATLVPLLEAIFKTRTKHDWLAALEAAKVPCGAINNLAEVFADPQVLARGMVHTWQHPLGGAVQLVASPIKMSLTPVRTDLPPPTLGQHTREVLDSIVRS